MIPNGVLSTAPMFSPFIEPVNKRSEPLVDYEFGGIAPNDPSQGLSVQKWTARVDGDDVKLSAPSVPEFVYVTRPGITEISLAFDQNMRPHIAFVQGGTPYLYWYDTTASAMVYTAFPGISNPKLCLDEKRLEQLGISDVLFCYINGNNLCYRQQRDRFATEYTLKTAVNAQLVSVGRNTGNRLQFKMRPN